MASSAAPAATLSEEEILHFFQDVFGLPLTRESLVKPDQLIMLYQVLLEEIGANCVTQPDLSAMQGIDNISRYDSFVSLSNIRMCVQEMLDLNGYAHEFTFQDLLQPKKKKSLRVLSCMIKSMAMATTAYEEWNERSAKLDEKLRQREQLYSRIQLLQKKLESKALQVAQYREEKPMLDKQVEAATKTYQQWKDTSDSISEAYRREKKERADRKEHLAERQLHLQRLCEENIELEARIVRSPDKIKSETVAMEQRVANLMSERRRLQQEYVEAMNHSDAVSQAQKDLKPVMDTLRDTFADLEVLRDKCDAASDSKEQVLASTQKLKELAIVEEQLRENVFSLQNQIKKNRVQYENQQRPLLQMNSDVKRAIDMKQQSCDSSSASHGSLLQNERSLTQKLEDLRLQRQQSEQQFSACLDKVTKAVHAAVQSNQLLG